eukprot:CAMPEP_0184332886 /NCGR_PEP_ID=MMETSP1089-20130417/2015_1 /TAXON_ID=38269 ORGANISM="Gloeochaete wittrockiana, Strain SAG46.84" /NCGR_SAMPLE_ID=MMETSP1089 /ASSEMBLY_ACC=CAM_ASM_000445 /LENGTH=552 /DNA_ID=CAMNT_0026656465 /DNA_START=37 /DNA_END=1692 /DNA_ORIENTATION=+
MVDNEEKQSETKIEDKTTTESDVPESPPVASAQQKESIKPAEEQPPAAKITPKKSLESRLYTVVSTNDESLGLFLILVILSFITRFMLIWHPAECVFDEVHFGKFSNSHIKNEFYFDIHPPLGKLMLGFWTRILAPEYTGDFPFKDIGDKFGDPPKAPFILMRSLPAFFNAWMAPLTYGIARKLGCSLPISFFAGLLVVFDVALNLQSRLILIDSFLIFFITLAVFLSSCAYNYASYENTFRPGYFGWLFLAGAAAGCAASVKWTALAVLVGILLHHGLTVLYRLFWKKKGRSYVKIFFDGAARGIILLVAPFMVYMLVQYWHFSNLTKAGPGDGFMSLEFRAALEGSLQPEEYDGPAANFRQMSWELTKVMYRINAGMLEPHPWMSPWYSWPFTKRGVSYATLENKPNPEGGAELHGRIYLMGNPAVWWGTTGGLALFILCALPILMFQIPLRPRSKWLLSQGFALFVQYGLNLLPYMTIARSTFLYHYFPALLFAILITSITLEFLMFKPWMRTLAVVLLSIPVIYLWWYFAPFLYGFPIPKDISDKRIW